MAGLARGEDWALIALTAAYGRIVYGKALQILGVSQLAEEVAQDTLLVLWWTPERFDDSRGRLLSFLVTTARNKSIDLVRREEATRNRESSFAQDLAKDGLGVEDVILVRSAISKLPLAKREVIFLAYYQGLSCKEIAYSLNIPVGTVKARKRDSLIRLRALVAQW